MGLFAAIAPALISTVGGALLGRGGGGGGGFSQPINPELQRQSALETEMLQRQQSALDALFQMAQQFDPTPIGRLDVPDSPFLDEDFLGGLRPQGDIDILRFLAQIGPSGAATRATTGVEENRNLYSEQQRAQQGSSIAGVIDSLLKLRQANQQQPDSGPTPTEVLESFVQPPGPSYTAWGGGF